VTPSTAAAVEKGSSAVRIHPFSDDLIEKVRDFNHRLAAAGITYRFPQSPVSAWLPRVDGRHIFQEYYLAVDGGGLVRGGYILKRQEFVINGTPQTVAFYHLPLSEGLVDRRYGFVGLRLLIDALKREPAMFVLGIGSMSEPLSQMLTALSWKLRPVPFHFRIMRPFRVARNIPYLRTTTPRRIALDIAAFSGAAWLGTQVMALKVEPGSRRITTTVENEFGGWADRIWNDCVERYTMIGRRDRDTLNILYPSTNTRFIRMRVEVSGVTVGWAVLLATGMRSHKYFGDLRVGSIVDCLAVPGHAADVVRGAVRCLQDSDVDLIVSNQMADAWVEGLKSNGFMAGPSTFLFGASKALENLLQVDESLQGVHLNRGDGDGPINL
jgi:hypothetical protein